MSGMLKFVRKSEVGLKNSITTSTSGILKSHNNKDKRQSAVLQQQEYLDKKKDEKSE